MKKKILPNKGSKRVNWQPAEWEKLLSSHVNDKELMCQIHKELLHTQSKKKNNLKREK